MNAKVEQFKQNCKKILKFTDFEFELFRISKRIKRFTKQEFLFHAVMHFPELNRSVMWRRSRKYVKPLENRMFCIVLK
jgi:hypothetical protein